MQQHPPHLLVVDDDRRIRALLQQFLEEQGFRVGIASQAAEARAYLACHEVDLIVLDIMMPGEDGIQFTQRLRQSNSIPILLLTARDQLKDRVLGLEEGADDYLVKPFETSELLARIRAILRRISPLTKQAESELRIGDFLFNRDTGVLRKDQEIVYLSSTEQILLKTLAQSPGEPFARCDLAQRIGHRVSERTVDVQITRLRKKLGDDSRQPLYLQTVRHIGYALQNVTFVMSSTPDESFPQKERVS